MAELDKSTFLSLVNKMLVDQVLKQIEEQLATRKGFSPEKFAEYGISRQEEADRLTATYGDYWFELFTSQNPSAPATTQTFMKINSLLIDDPAILNDDTFMGQMAEALSQIAPLPFTEDQFVEGVRQEVLEEYTIGTNASLVNDFFNQELASKVKAVYNEAVENIRAGDMSRLRSTDDLDKAVIRWSSWHWDDIDSLWHEFQKNNEV